MTFNLTCIQVKKTLRKQKEKLEAVITAYILNQYFESQML